MDTANFVFKPMCGVAPPYPAACADWFRILLSCSQNACRISRRGVWFFRRLLLSKDGWCGLIEAVKLVRAQRFAFQQGGEGGGVGGGDVDADEDAAVVRAVVAVVEEGDVPAALHVVEEVAQRTGRSGNSKLMRRSCRTLWLRPPTM